MCSMFCYSLGNREMGMYEVADLVSGKDLYQRSFTVQFLNAIPKEYRNRAPKRKDDIMRMRGDSTDIFKQSLLDVFYPLRHTSLENVSLHEIVRDYDCEKFTPEKKAGKGISAQLRCSGPASSKCFRKRTGATCKPVVVKTPHIKSNGPCK